MALVLVFLSLWPFVSAYFLGFWSGMSNTEPDNLVRERIAEELELQSVAAKNNGWKTSKYARAMGPNLPLLETTRVKVSQRRA